MYYKYLNKTYSIINLSIGKLKNNKKIKIKVALVLEDIRHFLLFLVFN